MGKAVPLTPEVRAEFAAWARGELEAHTTEVSYER